jgi:hypothetical protein
MAVVSPMLVSVMTQLCAVCRPVRKRGPRTLTVLEEYAGE